MAKGKKIDSEISQAGLDSEQESLPQQVLQGRRVEQGQNVAVTLLRCTKVDGSIEGRESLNLKRRTRTYWCDKSEKRDIPSYTSTCIVTL